jgi:hypothetical protein
MGWLAKKNVDGSMTRHNINRISAIVPFVMSAIALLLATVAGAAGWEKGATDEGALAHISQLLIVAQVPFATANWVRALPVARAAKYEILAKGFWARTWRSA